MDLRGILTGRLRPYASLALRALAIAPTFLLPTSQTGEDDARAFAGPRGSCVVGPRSSCVFGYRCVVLGHVGWCKGLRAVSARITQDEG
jgi:hypothetical protein